jgi:uncharacterized MnhB-related membrane protein
VDVILAKLTTLCVSLSYRILKEADVFLSIVIIAVVIGILFITAAVVLGCFIYNGVKKMKRQKRKVSRY